jgi:hypothetical protein
MEARFYHPVVLDVEVGEENYECGRQNKECRRREPENWIAAHTAFASLTRNSKFDGHFELA